ncbi:MAG: SMC-Scp complex subunit ScpB [Hyphomicrobiaceae bacterium]|nr:SMC-Scp complex subunit ScpB [Hyphomicrobiaceae bacterium]
MTENPTISTRQRQLEALLFAATEPLDLRTLRACLELEPEFDEGIVVDLEVLQVHFEGHGVHLVKTAGKWAFRTAIDLSGLLERHKVVPRKLSRAALETLAIIAYHQPTTRAEIEEIRGVATSKGTLDVLMETGWVRPRGRRMVPGRPITYGTSSQFLEHFGFDTIKELPGLTELKGAGLLDINLPPEFQVPLPDDGAELAQDELPLEEGFYSENTSENSGK